MAAGLSAAVTFKPLNRSFPFSSSNFRLRHQKSTVGFPHSLRFKGFSVCYVVEERKQSSPIENDNERSESTSSSAEFLALRLAEKLERKKSERFTYLIAAVMSSFGITSMAIMAVYYRFSWQMEGGEIPILEMFGTFALSVGAAVGMEFWARWAHKALWHASLWNMHESHHKPREGAFELNDVFAIVNAVPAIALLSYGFFNKGLVPGLCFGAWDVEYLFDVLVEKGKDSLFSSAGLAVVENQRCGASSFSHSSVMSCDICIEDVPGNPMTRMDCGHCFCNTCESLTSFYFHDLRRKFRIE